MMHDKQLPFGETPLSASSVCVCGCHAKNNINVLEYGLKLLERGQQKPTKDYWDVKRD